jgi:glycosyltransferase involved in cell wall biosynthesis
MSPKVSVNLCCYNSEQYLRETIQSVINQTYTDWELIVINDGSIDSTESIVYEYKDMGYPIIYHYQENQGLGSSRNKALSLSRGDYISFIDHDDVWLDSKLEKQVSVLEKNIDVDFTYSNFYSLSNNKKTIFSKKCLPHGYVFGDFLRYYPVAVVTVMFRKKALDGFNQLFDEKLKLSEDFDLFMRILYRSRAWYMNEPLAVYRVHSNMSSLKFIEKWPDEMEYIIDKLKRMETSVEVKYSKELNYVNAKIGYYRASTEMVKAGHLRADRLKARGYLRPFIWTEHRFIALFLMTYFPPVIWRKIHIVLGIGRYDGFENV